MPAVLAKSLFGSYGTFRLKLHGVNCTPYMLIDITIMDEALYTEVVDSVYDVVTIVDGIAMLGKRSHYGESGL